MRGSVLVIAAFLCANSTAFSVDPASSPNTTIAGTPGPCCQTCGEGLEKYYSIPNPDQPNNECGECCLKPSLYWFWSEQHGQSGTRARHARPLATP